MGDAVTTGALAGPHDFSLWALFLQAHIVVKLVMIGLFLASLWCWAIIIYKTMAYRRIRSRIAAFEDDFWSGQSLEELYRKRANDKADGLAAVFVAAMREWKRSFESQARSFAGLQMRIEKVMNVSIAREIERLERRLLVLATVGSAGPFVGLFGTVWGIMSSFQSIAASKNTSLAVVAPGIAEALFATAVGLIAAIPATIFYNKFTAEVNRQAQRLDIPLDRYVLNIERYGNTSSASIPIALDEARRDGRIKDGDTVLMCALGAGISWGSALVRI